MSEPNTPKSDVDIPFLAKHVGKAKGDFEKAATGRDLPSGDAGRASGSDSVSESIKLHVPLMALRPEGKGREIDANQAKDRVEKEVTTARFENVRKISELLRKSKENEHNKKNDNNTER